MAVIIESAAVLIPDKEIIAEALVIYAQRNVDYIDAYNAVLLKHLNLKEI